MPTEAGKGQHNYYLLKIDGAASGDTAIIEARKHYLGVDAVRWYVNKQGNFFSDRMASGTVKVDLSSASAAGVTEESYEVGLGTYELKEEERTAPFFDTVILANRLFLGGPIKIEVFIRALEQDTLLGGLLRDMAKASVNVVSGAIATATASGPQGLLIAAGKSLTKGVTDILDDKGKKPVKIFDPGGVNITLPPSNLRGPVNYLLVHRGVKLDLNQLKVTSDQQGEFEVIYNGTPLDDGAWALFRLRREDVYGYPRSWENDAQKVRGKLDALMDQWKLGGITQENVKAQLYPKGTKPPSLADDLFSVSALIRNDAVMAEREATKKVGQLESLLDLAQKAGVANNPQIYFDGRDSLESSLSAGQEPPTPAAEIFTAVAKQIASSRAINLASSAPELVGKNLWSTLRYVGDV